MKPRIVCKNGFLTGESPPSLADADGSLLPQLVGDHAPQL